MPGFELFGENERNELQDVLTNGVLMRYGFDGMRNGHWKSKELEKAICRQLKVNYAQLTSSGTAALTVALSTLGIGYGDEVIMPTFTFVASFEAIIALGAKPILVDIDDTLGLSPVAVEKVITSRTKAIMVVHMCGAMADVDPLLKICKQHKIAMVEDACQAWGGTYKGIPLGSIGDIGCFSFDYVKTITCGEGGVLVTNDKRTYEMADQYTDHGHDHIGQNRGAEGHPFIGYNFRMSELHAAVGLAQIKRTANILEIQRRNKKIIKDTLSQSPSISFRRIPDETGDSAGFLSFFLTDSETTVRAEKALQEKGIDAFWNYYDNNWHYVRSWNHLKKAKTMQRISPDMQEHLLQLGETSFSDSDAWMARNLSFLIKLSCSEEDVKRRADLILETIHSVC